MILRFLWHFIKDLSIPRESGDDPKVDTVIGWVLRYSPRERG